MKVVAISGYFDPIHVGHLEYINMAKKLKQKRFNTQTTTTTQSTTGGGAGKTDPFGNPIK